MVNLTQRWAELFMTKYPEISVQVTGGGSGTGIASLLNGTANIANISRELKDKEIEKAKSLNIFPKKFEVALDGIAIIVNPENHVNSLSLKEIKDIYSGVIKNWSEVGGLNHEIILYGRENSSGTYEYFKQSVLGKNDKGFSVDFSVRTQVLQGTAALGEAVSKDIRGIGYGGVGYFANREDLKVVYIESDENPGLKFSPVLKGEVNYEIIWNGNYPLSRYLYCYTNGAPTNEIKKFIDFIISDKGQEIVKNMQYIPLSSEK
jgi:phosphate transport system substrate-binding protein